MVSLTRSTVLTKLLERCANYVHVIFDRIVFQPSRYNVGFGCVTNITHRYKTFSIN